MVVAVAVVVGVGIGDVVIVGVVLGGAVVEVVAKVVCVVARMWVCGCVFVVLSLKVVVTI